MTPCSPLRLALAGLAIALPLSRASADTLTGQLVDSQGVGLAGIDIDVEEMATGDPVTINNGATGPGGIFNVTLPAGNFRVIFKPPAPPASDLLVEVVENVLVSGTTGLGIVTMDSGFVISGTVVGPTSLPVVGVDLDVVVAGTSVQVPQTSDDTGAGGQFAVTVPAGNYEVRFDTSPVASPLLAPTEIPLAVSADVSLGAVQLQTGFRVVAVVRRPNGTPVQGVDLDAEDSLTGEGLYTPGDDTDGVGFVDIVVPAGTYDIELCAPTAERLVTQVLQGVVVSGQTNLGILVMQNGVLLSGRVTSPAGVGLADVDLDVRLPGTQVGLPTCRDDSDDLGFYAVVVPTGTFDLEYEPRLEAPFCTKNVLSVAVPGDTVLDVTLQPCDFGQPEGSGVPGSGGIVPAITATGGGLRLGNPNWTLRVTQGLGGAPAVVLVSVGETCSPFVGGGLLGIATPRRLLAALPVQLAGAPGVSGAGGILLPFPLPTSVVFDGLTLSARALIADGSAPGGRSATPRFCGVLCK